MEPHSNLRLLFISLCLVVSLNSALSRLPPDASPAPQPVASPIESLISSPLSSPLSSSSPSPSPSPSPDLDFSDIDLSAASTSEAESEPYTEDIVTGIKNAFGVDFSADLHGVKVNPELKKICDQTDHASLCLATVLPLVKGDKPDIDSVLKVAVQAGSVFAKQALAEAKKQAAKPGTPEDLLLTLKDCEEFYDRTVDNFQKTLDAFLTNDVGRMNTMLSAVITFVGDCQDEFTEMEVESPLTGYAEKLTEMASNCLAISSLRN